MKTFCTKTFYTWKTTTRRARRSGAAMVEFAFIVPILLVLSMVMIQFGIVLNAKVSLSHVARSVSRYAAIHGTDVSTGGSTDNDIKDFGIDAASGFGLSLTRSDFTVGPPAENTTGNTDNRKRYGRLPITVTYDMQNRYFLPTNFFGITLARGTATETTTVMME